MTDVINPPRPWLASYGATIPQELAAPKYNSLADLVQQAADRHGKRRAFTCVASNGMNGTLSYQKVGQMSDAFAAFLHHECGLEHDGFTLNHTQSF
jgi:long-chain acyl-CoA synthetase